MGGRFSGETTWRRSRCAVPVVSPAAGADWSLVVPAGHVYRLRSVYAQLVTSAVVATRVADLIVKSGERTVLILPPFASQAASLTRQYAWFPEAGGDTTGNGVSTSIPGLDLPAGWSLGSSTALIDVADAWSGIMLLVDDLTVTGGPENLDEAPDMVVALGAVLPGPG